MEKKNGYISKYFINSRGVRQGCPLSPYLFVICTEILNILIKSNDIIHGICIDGTHYKITQYADDTVIICNGSKSSLYEVHNVLNNFTNISGLKVNFTKSFLFPLGPFVSNQPNHQKNFVYPFCTGPITYLGISFTFHHDDFFRLNYVPKLSRIKNLLQTWGTRDLTPID